MAKSVLHDTCWFPWSDCGRHRRARRRKAYRFLAGTVMRRPIMAIDVTTRPASLPRPDGMGSTVAWSLIDHLLIWPHSAKSFRTVSKGQFHMRVSGGDPTLRLFDVSLATYGTRRRLSHAADIRPRQ